MYEYWWCDVVLLRAFMTIAAIRQHFVVCAMRFLSHTFHSHNTLNRILNELQIPKMTILIHVAIATATHFSTSGFFIVFNFNLIYIDMAF